MNETETLLEPGKALALLPASAAPSVVPPEVEVLVQTPEETGEADVAVV